MLLLLFAFRDLWKECGDSNFQSQNCQFHHRRLDVVGTFNVLDIYPSEHYGLSFLDLTDAISFYKVSFFFFFFVYISILQVHFACVLCI